MVSKTRMSPATGVCKLAKGDGGWAVAPFVMEQSRRAFRRKKVVEFEETRYLG